MQSTDIKISEMILLKDEIKEYASNKASYDNGKMMKEFKTLDIALKEAIDYLPEEDRIILAQVLVKGVIRPSTKELEPVLGYSSREIRRKRQAILKKIREYIERRYQMEVPNE